MEKPVPSSAHLPRAGQSTPLCHEHAVSGVSASLAAASEDFCAIWLPPAVRESFARIRRALERGHFSRVDYLSKKFQRRFPAYAGFYLDMEANAHKLRGHAGIATDLFVRANEALQGEMPPTLHNAVNHLLAAKRNEEARTLVDQGLRLFPDDTDLRQAHCYLLSQQGMLKQALALVREACEQTPTPDFWQLRGDICFQLGLHEEGMAAYTGALKLAPDFEAAWQNRIFLAHYLPANGQRDLLGLIQSSYETFCAPLPPTDPALLKRDARPDKTLRVGLISPGFCKHPVGWMAGQAVSMLSKLPDCELYFYSLKKVSPLEDSLRALFQDAAAKWIDAKEWSSERLYKRLLADKLDIAVDMAGHSEGCVLPLFARRIAPVQVKWMGGLFNTTGVPEMDYLLTDRHETPDGCDDAYAEKLVRLPHSYIAYDLYDYGDTERITEGEAAEPLPIRFASFNKICKLNAVIAGVWAEILNQVPGSTLFLKNLDLEHADAAEQVRALFAEHGITGNRLELEGPSGHKDLMRTYRKVDIALDTWPYTGGVTTLEALWMGVPVITTPGPSFAGRHALSHLCNAGLESLVAKDFEEYVKIAVTLAGDRRLLADLRILLPYSLATSPITRPYQLAADLHTAFRAMWERHCAGLPPVAMRFEQPSEIPDAFKPFIPDIPKKEDSAPEKTSSFPSISR